LTRDVEFVDKLAFKFTIQTRPGKWRSCNGRPTGTEGGELRLVTEISVAKRRRIFF